MKQALVVDDEAAIAHCFESLFAGLDCEVTVTASAEDGLDLARRNAFDVIVLDVRLPGIDGVSALPQFRKITDAPIVVMTAHGTLSTAVSVVQEGAFEYLPKPFDLDHVTRILRRALSQSARSVTDADSTTQDYNEAELIGDSLPMQHLFRQIALAAQHSAPVLVTGESGTGKELVARAIHQHSSRRDKPLVPVHLASLSEGLLERELFGHTAGAFTGAERSQTGVIAQADGGTLFLDEIGETPVSFQVKLLRTIETQEYYPVGSSGAQKSDFRLVAATNRTPEFLRSSEQFRPDFYYRLATIQISVPSLREHSEDIPKLAQHFLQRCTGDETRTFTNDAIAKLKDANYPGNVRELRSTVIRAAAESSEQQIGVDAIQHEPGSPECSKPASAAESLRTAAKNWAEENLADGGESPFQSAAEIIEAELLTAALSRTNGNRSAAAKLLGIHRETLREKLTKYGLDPS